MIIGCIYRPPDTDINSFNDVFAASLDVINKEGKLCFLHGDFNINLVNGENHSPTADFINVLFSSYFYPVITKPTSVTHNSATLIDNITNSFISSSNFGVLFSDTSDHFPIFHFTSNQTNKNQCKDSNNTVRFRKFIAVHF